jgi:hypothetical protein
MEPETFDYKERLPDSRDESGKKRLRKECCAFANSSGGFLIFGVKDDTTVPADDRLVGIDPHFNFLVNFGNFPSGCSPSVRWEPKNPAIPLPCGKVVHVIWFPRSWNGPHSVGDAEPGFVFPKRTHRGIEHMNYEEVRMSFLGYYEKRLKLQLLRVELVNIRDDVHKMLLPADEWTEMVTTCTFDLSVLESVLVDTFTILVSFPRLLERLNSIRNTAKIINRHNGLVSSVAYSSHSKGDRIFANHNLWLQRQCPDLKEAVDEAIDDLDKVLANS